MKINATKISLAIISTILFGLLNYVQLRRTDEAQASIQETSAITSASDCSFEEFIR